MGTPGDSTNRQDAGRRARDRRAALNRGARWGRGRSGARWAVDPELRRRPSCAAAASGTATPVMRKAASGSQPPTAPCTYGGQSPDVRTGRARGPAVFVVTENPATICATITLSTGQPTTNRTAGGTCMDTYEAGAWPGEALGPLTYSAPIPAGANTSVEDQVASGGIGGNGLDLRDGDADLTRCQTPVSPAESSASFPCAGPKETHPTRSKRVEEARW